MGPCFARLATWLQHSHREVKQVCFNAGDAWYAAKETSLHYTGPVKNFAFWLRDLHKEYAFDTIVCFGDCRPMHVEAKKWARGKAIDFLSFEEGYFRPFYITLEKGGVNAFSSMPIDAKYYREQPLPELKTPTPWKPSAFNRAAHAMLYYAAGWLVAIAIAATATTSHSPRGMRCAAGSVPAVVSCGIAGSSATC